MIDFSRLQVSTNILSDVSTWFKVYTLILTIIGTFKSSGKLLLLWNTRHVRKIWGIKDGENVTIICSELDEPEQRQNVEPNEFIYNLKYGDLDAYFEVVTTLLKLYPKIKLKIISSGEAENTKFDMAQTIILIGGPDYNAITEKILEKNITQIKYRSPYSKEKSRDFPNEIVLHNTSNQMEYFELDEFKDFGYFEKLKNPYDPSKNIILIGGCHTIGVTAAVKAFSLAPSEHGEIPKVVLKNASSVAKRISKQDEFVLLMKAERISQSISTPIITQATDLLFKKSHSTFYQKVIKLIKESYGRNTKNKKIIDKEIKQSEPVVVKSNRKRSNR